ncbi:hypothetical protein COT54_00350 [Candidatus Collierbacteria bacterium CG09_land_8_20_14_0_10_46_12]|uniref:SpoVT-AbrB domain-containing protein n=1 Tax=Candidatus Collierbacteria bacterium CG09_land_8_20_14_0_10_46_12 TaxID=1974533 RepID=A0A2H0X034_9BACT|nr:MAG: hypothetical protein COT54_00350 [Candidatus Collierbacteria bacterium CG09_land_8_20_14_0_10_46_12]
MLQKMVSLTDQNQISIPKWMVEEWGPQKPKKLFVVKLGDEIHLRPVKNFWSVVGSLKSEIKLTDEELRDARAKFEKNWARKI